MRLPFFAAVGESSTIFLLLRVHRNHRLRLLVEPFDLAVEEVKLGLAVRRGGPFLRFAVRWEAIAQGRQQPLAGSLTDRMALRG